MSATMTHSNGVVVYSGENCSYCVRARRLLEKKGVAYREIKVDQSPALRAEMESLSQRRTIPQIFIDGQHIGGFDDLAALDGAGELDPLLVNILRV
jgi:glutaredoxin 3